MDIATYKNQPQEISEYLEVSVNDMQFDGNYLSIKDNPAYGSIYITDNMRESLCRFVGVSPSLNRGLYSLDQDLWREVLTKLFKYHGKEIIILLLGASDDDSYVKGVCTTTRSSVSSVSFVNKVLSHFEDVQDTIVSDIDYSKDNLVSHVVVLGSKTYTDVHNRVFNLGVVFRNDETSNSTCKMVLKYVDSEVYYLPSKLYNLSSSRYDRTTSNSMESLEVLLLRVSEDFLTNRFDDMSQEILDKIRSADNKYISYQEFDRLRVVLLKMARSSDFIEDDVNEISSKLDELNDFEKLYGKIDNDYLWKCTAISENSLGKVLMFVDSITSDYKFYPEEVTFLRDLLGEYLIDSRVCQHIAKRQ